MLLFAGMALASLGVVYSTSTQHQYCLDLNPQNSLDLGQIMGMWFGIEVLPHIREEDGIRLYDSCPIVHLADLTNERTTTESHLASEYGYQWSRRGYTGLDFKERDYRFLRLYWDDGGNGLEYTLKYNNTRRGFWVAGTPEYGTGEINYDASGFGYGSDLQYANDKSLSRVSSNRPFTFTGTVQVLKAVSNQLVLTFCQRSPEQQLFTIILAREPNQLTSAEIHTIHNLLNRRDLSTSAIKKVCNASSVLTSQIFTHLLSCSFAYFVLAKY